MQSLIFCALFLGELPGLTCSCPYKVSSYELALQPRIPRSLLRSTMHQIPSLCTCHIYVREQREVPWIIRHPRRSKQMSLRKSMAKNRGPLRADAGK
ncbi:hypothetical protein BJV77DRAFT_48688 [Russula vinacea]|nr:hypothetical protein BJV77DRAFT_48688 [Russula vinacea]